MKTKAAQNVYTFALMVLDILRGKKGLSLSLSIAIPTCQAYFFHEQLRADASLNTLKDKEM